MNPKKSKIIWIMLYIILIIINSYFFFDGEPIFADYISLIAVILCSIAIGVRLYD